MKKTIVLTLALTLASTNIALATSNNSNANNSNRVQAQETVQNRFEARCQNITDRIDTKISNFDSNKEKHMANYNNMVDRIAKFDKRLKDAGYDTTKLEADLATLKTDIETFSTDYKTYANSLKATRGYTCGHSEGDFRTNLNQSKTNLKKVRTDAAEIRTFYRQTIRQDLLDLKAQSIENEKDENLNNESGSTESEQN